MSLTSFLRNSDVMEAFKVEFVKPQIHVEQRMVAPPFTKHYSLVGTAFDYLLRFYLQRLNPDAIDKGYWVAERSVDFCLKGALKLKGEKIIIDARRHVTDYLKTGQLSYDLGKSALLLAGLDPIFRADVGHNWIGFVDEDDMEDLRGLISVVEPSIFRTELLCMVNPTFGEASVLVGGADADLVIGDNLIDIKTTIRPVLTLSVFNQLLGYYVLHEIGGLGNLKPKPKTERVSVYFSRHACLCTLALEDLINLETFPTFVKWFKQRASERKE